MATNVQFSPYTGGTLTGTVTSTTETNARILVKGTTEQRGKLALTVTITPSADSSYAYDIEYDGISDQTITINAADVVIATARRYPATAAEACRVHLEVY
jgi:hypothetical protein